jgi:hypothetical protein
MGHPRFFMQKRCFLQSIFPKGNRSEFNRINFPFQQKLLVNLNLEAVPNNRMSFLLHDLGSETV